MGGGTGDSACSGHIGSQENLEKIAKIEQCTYCPMLEKYVPIEGNCYEFKCCPLEETELGGKPTSTSVRVIGKPAGWYYKPKKRCEHAAAFITESSHHISDIVCKYEKPK